MIPLRGSAEIRLHGHDYADEYEVVGADDDGDLLVIGYGGRREGPGSGWRPVAKVSRASQVGKLAGFTPERVVTPASRQSPADDGQVLRSSDLIVLKPDAADYPTGRRQREGEPVVFEGGEGYGVCLLSESQWADSENGISDAVLYSPDLYQPEVPPLDEETLRGDVKRRAKIRAERTARRQAAAASTNGGPE